MMPSEHEAIDSLRVEAFKMTPAQQFRLASFVAENVGYVLQPEDVHPDSPHADAPGARTSRWRYEILDGPEGEFENAEFARVFDDKGASVCTARIHHAFMIVGSINSDEMVTIETPPIPAFLQREWMAQALFEVDAPGHLEWDDASLYKRERYLCLADAAISKLRPATTVTEEMVRAGRRAAHLNGRGDVKSVYEAMLAANYASGK